MTGAAGLQLDLRLAPPTVLTRREMELVRSTLIERLKTLKPRSRERVILEGKLAELTLYLLRS
ncbi:MAG: hypothetical protein K2X10_10360 [Hyphomicrobiales bacterium]|nr:hypothetical protein [Hyphomicrobiales bacterium]